MNDCFLKARAMCWRDDGKGNIKLCTPSSHTQSPSSPSDSMPADYLAWETNGRWRAAYEAMTGEERRAADEPLISFGTSGMISPR